MDGSVAYDTWEAEGARGPVRLRDGGTAAVWSRATSAGAGAPHVTFLHGFPTHSHDWAAVARAVAGRVDTLTFDFLGFGSSDKPAGHAYSLLEQADLTEQVWARHGVARTVVVAHDYAVSVAQELLARRIDGGLAVRLAAVVFLNGGLWPDLHRALPAQKMLLDPEQGPRLSALVSEETFGASLAVTFAPGRIPSPAAQHETWLGVARRDGHRRGHETIRYIADRLAHRDRWAGALASTDVPRSFVWGMLDPISGAHVAERIAERFPNDPLRRLDDVGHWPPVEAPAEVTAGVLAAVARSW